MDLPATIWTYQVLSRCTMSKSSRTSKMSPLVIPLAKPRNPFGVGVGMAKAGSHQKSNKLLRLQDKKTTRDAAQNLKNRSNQDNFAL